jgi:hypothetical protein
VFKFTLYIAAFILSFSLFLAYLTGFQPLAPASVQQAEQHPLVGIPPARGRGSSHGQRSAVVSAGIAVISTRSQL